MRFSPLHRALPALLVAATLAMALPAAAGDDREGRHERGERYERYERDDRHDRWDERSDRRHDRWDERSDRREHRYEHRYDRWDERRDRRARVIYREIYHGPVYIDGPPPRHYGPPRWARGHRLHDYAWAPTYIVVDYHRYGLRHPPRGHHWRRDDRGDWLLVAIATGIVVDVMLNR